MNPLKRLGLILPLFLSLIHCSGASFEVLASENTDVENWLTLLRSRDEKTRLVNAYNISELVPFSKDAILGLVKALHDKDPFVRRCAAAALGEATTEFDIIVPALLDSLRDEAPDVREHATYALVKIGSPAVPSLVKALGRMGEGFPSSSKSRSRREARSRRITGGRGRTRNRTTRPAPARFNLERTDVRISDYAAIALMRIDDEAIPEVWKALRSGTPTVRRYAEYILLKSGNSALPLFAEHIDDPDPMVREVAQLGLEEIRPNTESELSIFRKLLKSSAPHIRLAAIGPLANIGSDALPELDKALKDNDERVRLGAVKALARIAEVEGASASVPRLLTALGDKSNEIKSVALEVLLDLKSKFQNAAPFIALLKSANAKVRWQAVEALGRLDTDDPAVVPALIEALGDVDATVRSNAVRSLGAAGSRARPAVPRLINVFRTFDPESEKNSFTNIRRDILVALGNIGDTRPEVVTLLTQSLQDSNGWIQESAAQGLKTLGEASADISVPALVKAIQAELARSPEKDSAYGSPYNATLRTFIEALSQIKGPGLTALVSLLSTTDSHALRRNGAYVLGNLESDDERIVPTLRLLLGDGSREVRRYAAEALGKRGTHSVPFLIEGLNNSDAGFREDVLEALKQIGPDALPAIPAISAQLQAPDREVRIDAAEAITNIDPTNEAGIRALVEGLDVPEVVTTSNTSGMSYSYNMAVRILIKIGPPAVPALAQALQSRNVIVRRNASSVLRSIGPQAKDALPNLTQALKDPDAEVRLNAAQAIREMGSKATSSESLERALSYLLTDVNAEVRLAAAYALLSIGAELKKSVPAFSTVVNDDSIRSLITEALPDLIEEVRPPLVVPTSARGDRLPVFPWPPPRFSDWHILPSHLFGSDNNTLGDVREKLRGVLSGLGYDSQGLFEVPDGFALVTRVERIQDDGTAFPSPARWTRSRIPPSGLSDYLRTLLLEKPGQFRLFVFIFTPLGNFEHSQRTFSEDEAWDLVNAGGRVLTPELRQTPFRGYYSHVLIYLFRKKAGQAATIEYQDPLGPETHLRRSGILDRF
jgi:HEAT repeat protein